MPSMLATIDCGTASETRRSEKMRAVPTISMMKLVMTPVLSRHS